jgi:RNA polymerase sigma-70 factor (ECF subfamily)
VKDITDLLWERSDDAIPALAAQYGGLCRHVVGNVLSSREDTDECINDVYLAVWNTIPPERPLKLSAFICKIARNLALKKYRYNTCAIRDSANSVPITEIEEYISHGADVAASLESAETIAQINDFLRGLSFNERNMFLRKYIIGDSIAQISAMFGFSEGKVKTSLHRTKSKLKAYLIKKGVSL